jgi:hypothetical protein
MHFFAIITRTAVYTSMRHKVGDTRKLPNAGSLSSYPKIRRRVPLVAEGVASDTDTPDGESIDGDPLDGDVKDIGPDKLRFGHSSLSSSSRLGGVRLRTPCLGAKGSRRY